RVHCVCSCRGLGAVASSFNGLCWRLSGKTLWEQCPGMAGDLLVFLQGENRVLGGCGGQRGGSPSPGRESTGADPGALVGGTVRSGKAPTSSPSWSKRAGHEAGLLSASSRPNVSNSV
ncbi:MAG: hypothetical protein ACHBMF_07895, partial [Chromatiales bacterium]